MRQLCCEVNFVCLALGSQEFDPGGVHCAGVGAELGAGLYPGDTCEREIGDWADEGFSLDKALCCGDLGEGGGAVCSGLVFDCDAQGDVSGPGELGRERQGSFGSFCEDCEGVLWAVLHDAEDVADELCGDSFVEEVAEWVDDDEPRECPLHWEVQGFAIGPDEACVGCAAAGLLPHSPDVLWIDGLRAFL